MPFVWTDSSEIWSQVSFCQVYRQRHQPKNSNCFRYISPKKNNNPAGGIIPLTAHSIPVFYQVNSIELQVALSLVSLVCLYSIILLVKQDCFFSAQQLFFQEQTSGCLWKTASTLWKLNPLPGLCYLQSCPMVVRSWPVGGNCEDSGCIFSSFFPPLLPFQLLLLSSQDHRKVAAKFLYVLKFLVLAAFGPEGVQSYMSKCLRTCPSLVYLQQVLALDTSKSIPARVLFSCQTSHQELSCCIHISHLPGDTWTCAPLSKGAYFPNLFQNSLTVLPMLAAQFHKVDITSEWCCEK